MKKADYIYAIGRRRSSAARVRLHKGKGENMVNDKPFEKYFKGQVAKNLIAKPFGVTETSEKYYFTARILGGGMNGQLEALILAVSRALVKVSPEKFRPLLRKLNLLSRDSRVRQRRMVGMGGKSRREKQSPKR